jgi:hypothetical protein
VNTRPASSVFFQALNVLIRSTRHVDGGVGLAVGERGFHSRQAPVERKPRRPRMPGQHLVLLNRGAEAALECGVPGHLTVSIPWHTDTTTDLA